MQTGKLIVLTGPSGVGKGTLVRSLLRRYPQLYLSISATTRQPRPGEVDGRDYYFVSREKFKEMVAANELLEWAEYAGNYYGTPRTPVEEQIQLGQSVLLEIEVVGARQIQKTFPTALRIFILPPNLEELEQRILGRGKDSEEAIARRLEHAKAEIEAADEFDLQIVNDDLDEALVKVEGAIFG
ncbi:MULTISPECIES: guanylate kinase [unclassified Coleofasciculus]|uniref:guanylate kinase n=1 Tax=unclassified Coleofasciculus TaxID=2692782 RepID=UPI00187FE5FE|nr:MULTISPECIES: guanylate kinase [unclassified Coleofasciculus]MBE9125948.1 guanylate kinase [Coleofasciculus sp. LEGE 07081]MBE9149320.1 guanylate kinase [Coleofasciculus sp. LEGE 07092]